MIGDLNGGLANFGYLVIRDFRGELGRLLSDLPLARALTGRLASGHRADR